MGRSEATGAAAVLVVMLMCGCPPTCDRGLCDGCCDETGECLRGNSRNYCGLGGVTCGRCSTGQSCQSGQCVEPADAGSPDAGTSCAFCSSGCCAADFTCQPGNLPEACGTDAGVCVVCAAGQRCAAGRCSSMSCAGCLDAVGVCRSGSESIACGSGGRSCGACLPGELCASGQCVGGTTCSAANCPAGCCTAGGCQPSSSPSCGIGGRTCVTCVTPQVCMAGTCR